MTYRGEVEITERDDAAHRAVMKARAKESRGQGTADADVTMALTGDDRRTSATVTTEVQLSGKVATMGQGVLQDVSGRLVQTFAENLARMLEGGAEPAPPAAAAAGTAAEATAATATPPTTPPRPAPAAEPDDALDLGSIGGAVIAGRLQDPRTLGPLLMIVGLIGFLLGRKLSR
jgi:hypothetical protein